MLNLETLAVSAAANMVGSTPKESENMINKALMVLAEQGVTAFALFLASRKRAQDTETAELIHRAMSGLLKAADLGQLDTQSINIEAYKALTQARQDESQLAALQRLLLTKQLMETALTYARYQAKAKAV